MDDIKLRIYNQTLVTMILPFDVETVLVGVRAMRAVLEVQGKSHALAYFACNNICKEEDGYEALTSSAAQGAAQFPAWRNGRRACGQTTHSLPVLYEHARAMLPLFEEQMRAVVGQFNGRLNEKGDAAAVKLHTSPLKGLYRCVEKMCLQGDERRYKAVCVCDMVRCIVECDDCGLKNEVLRALLAAPGLRVQRVKVGGMAPAAILLPLFHFPFLPCLAHPPPSCTPACFCLALRSPGSREQRDEHEVDGHHGEHHARERRADAALVRDPDRAQQDAGGAQKSRRTQTLLAAPRGLRDPRGAVQHARPGVEIEQVLAEEAFHVVAEGSTSSSKGYARGACCGRSCRETPVSSAACNPATRGRVDGARYGGGPYVLRQRRHRCHTVGSSRNIGGGPSARRRMERKSHDRKEDVKVKVKEALLSITSTVLSS